MEITKSAFFLHIKKSLKGLKANATLVISQKGRKFNSVENQEYLG
jgi:hypothetical protein